VYPCLRGGKLLSFTILAKRQMADVGTAQTPLVDSVDPLLDDAEEAESKVLL